MFSIITSGAPQVIYFFNFNVLFVIIFYFNANYRCLKCSVNKKITCLLTFSFLFISYVKQVELNTHKHSLFALLKNADNCLRFLFWEPTDSDAYCCKRKYAENTLASTVMYSSVITISICIQDIHWCK